MHEYIYMQQLIELLKGHDGGDILDIATGRGGFVPFLKETFPKFKSITGIDNNAEHIEKAKKAFDDCRFRCMSAYNIVFDDNSFDTTTISNSLHHLENVEKSLQEMVRVTRPGGVILISEMLKDTENPLQLSHVLVHHWWAEVDRLEGIVHKETFAREYIESEIGKLGLRKVDILIEDESEDSDRQTKERFVEIINDYIKKAHMVSSGNGLVDRGHELIDRINTIGLAGAPQLIAVCKK